MTTSQLSLRPLGAGELLDRAARLYRRHFLTFFAIVAAVQIPLALLQLGASVLNSRLASSINTSQELFFNAFLPTIVTLLVAVLGTLVIQTLGTAAMTRAIADSYLGEPVSFAGSYRKIGKRWPALIAALLLMILVSIGLVIWWIVVPCVGWLTGFGMLLFASLVISPLIAPIIVLENSPARSSIRRAWELARRRFWPVIGFMIALAVLGVVFTAIPQLIISFLGLSNLADVGATGSGLTLNIVLSSLIGLIVGLLYLPFRLAAVTLMYFDLRVRTEAFDLELLANNASPLAAAPATPVSDVLTAPVDELLTPTILDEADAALADSSLTLAPLAPSSAVLTAPPLKAKTKLVTGEELAYFLLLTIVVGGVYFLLVMVLGGIGMLAAGAF